MKPLTPLALLSLVLLPALALTAADPPSCDRLFPCAITVGKPTTIHAEGKFPTWPVEIFCDRSDVKVQCETDSGKLQIEVPPNAPPGIAWLRLYDPQGASQLCPLLLETTPVQVEQEPNNELSAAAEVALPALIAGRLEKSEDVDGYRIALDKGETLVARVIGKRILNSAMDAVMQITDLSGNVLSQSDDEVGVDPQLVYSAPDSQQVVVRVFAFPETPNSTIGFAGSAGYTYALKLSKTPVADHFLPLMVADEVALSAYGFDLEASSPTLSPPTSVAPPVGFAPATLHWQWMPQLEGEWTSVMEGVSPDEVFELPAMFSGHISVTGQIDAFRFRATAGKKIRARVHSREYGFPLDSVLQIVNAADGSELARNDDSKRNEYDASLEFTPKADGDLELHISDLVDSASPRHAYSVQLEEVKPSVSISMEADRFALTAGESLEIPVAITREDGFDRKLSIELRDLPSGLQCEPVISEAKGDSSKAVKLKVTADKSADAAQRSFQVIATDADAPESVWHATYPLRPQVSLQHFWLTLITGSSP